MVDDAALLDRERVGQAAYYRILARGHRRSRLVEAGAGVQATIVPATPERSLPNSVVYLGDPAAVLGAYDALATAYAESGVAAWTVWVRPGDDELAAGLEARGHALDGTPAIMGAALADLDLQPRTDPDVDEAAGWDVVGALNDAAYGLKPGSLGPSIAGLAADAMTVLVARSDGVPAACVAYHVTNGDCQLEYVATLPRARGRGLAGELAREALRRARAAGATTTTLESSSLGQPVYERLGYRVLGRLRMFERREPV